MPDEVKLAHLLGVAQGRLVATGDRVLLVRRQDRQARPLLARQRHGPSRAIGRGLLAGDKIYWPTRTEIHILDQATGLRIDPPIKLQESFQTTGGNLAVGDGYLIVAQADALVVFCQNSRLIQRYREEIARAPEQASNYFRLAQAAEATGEDELALEAPGRRRCGGPGRRRRSTARPLADAARDHQYRLLDEARAQGPGGQGLGAGGRSASRRPPRSPGRTATGSRARLALADVQLDRGDAARRGRHAPGPARRRAAPAPERRRRGRPPHDPRRPPDRRPARPRSSATHGRGLYAEFDRRGAATCSNGARREGPATARGGRAELPGGAGRARVAAGPGRSSHDALNRPAEAAHAYKRLLAAAPSDALRARALLGPGPGLRGAAALGPGARHLRRRPWRGSRTCTLEEFGTERPARRRWSPSGWRSSRSTG